MSSDGSTEVATTKIGFISPHVDNQTQSVLVKGTVPNPAGALRASQYVRARIVWTTNNALVVPVTAVLRINGQFFAFVAEKGEQGLIARQKAVQVGEIIGNDYVMQSGLNVGEQLIVSGLQKIRDGAPVMAAPPSGAPRKSARRCASTSRTKSRRSARSRTCLSPPSSPSSIGPS